MCQEHVRMPEERIKIKQELTEICWEHIVMPEEHIKITLEYIKKIRELLNIKSKLN